MQGRVSCYESALIVPFKQASYACYDQEGLPIPEGMIYRNFCRVFNLAPRPAFASQNKREVIFGGFLFKHYGHFLLESLARLWFAKRNPDLPICWVGRDGGILGFQQEILELLGITNTIYLADRPVQFAKIYFPEPGCIIREHFYPFQRDFLAVYKPKPTKPGLKIYLSRRNFGGESCLSNDQEVEALLEELGFTIYLPEEHSVREQLDTLSSAELILSLEGSALHTLLLLQEVQAEIVIIPRVNQIPNMNYTTIANAKGFRQTYLPLDDLYLETEATHESFINYRGKLNLELLASYLEAPAFDPYSLYGHMFLTNPKFNRKHQEPYQALVNELNTVNGKLKYALKENIIARQNLEHELASFKG